MSGTSSCSERSCSRAELGSQEHVTCTTPVCAHCSQSYTHRCQPAQPLNSNKLFLFPESCMLCTGMQVVRALQFACETVVSLARNAGQISAWKSCPLTWNGRKCPPLLNESIEDKQWRRNLQISGQHWYWEWRRVLRRARASLLEDG